MIKKIGIKNFKGIGDPGVELEFKPITLLFGPNSGGKSTIIQAIHYAREIFLRRNFDPSSTLSGGSILNLGGFKNIVHNHSTDNKIVFKFSLDLESVDLSSGIQKYYNREETEDGLENNSSLERDIFDDLCAGVFDAEITLKVELNKKSSIVRGVHFNLDINYEKFATIELDDSNPKDIHAFFYFLNINHSIIKQPVDEPEPGGLFYAITGTEKEKFKLRLIKPQSVFTLGNEILTVDPQHFNINSVTFGEPKDHYELPNHYRILIISICRLIDVITDELRENLKIFRYIGPLREIPSRNFIPESLDELGRWSNGLFAWDKLYNNKINVNEVNKWLDKLYIEYKIIKVNQIEVDDSDLEKLKKASDSNYLFEKLYTLIDAEPSKDKLLRDLKDLFIQYSIKKIDNSAQKIYLERNGGETKILPSDLGVGISQVIPIVVGVLSSSHQFKSFLSIEQPELHIHPAIQVELADLFILAVNPILGKDVIKLTPPNTFLIETHSEHLMLRFLRRIEETTNKNIKEGITLNNDQINVYWCESTDNGLKIDLLPIDDTGEFTRQWPRGFFEERAEELFPNE